MKLDQWLASKEKSTDAFAAELEVSRETVRRYLSGERKPEWDVMHRIVALTKGAVTANDFLDVKLPREAARG
jgi:predicted transcriptional regulator